MDRGQPVTSYYLIHLYRGSNPGKMSSYYQSRTSDVYGVTISLTVLATFLVIARLIARRMSAAKLWWDDLALVAALVSECKRDPLNSEADISHVPKFFVWGLSVCYWSNIKHGGLGRHSKTTGGPVGPDTLETNLKAISSVTARFHIRLMHTLVSPRCSNCLLCFGSINQDVPHSSLLPCLRSDTMVPAAFDSCVDNCAA